MGCVGLGVGTNPEVGHVRVDLSAMDADWAGWHPPLVLPTETWTEIIGVYEITLDWSAEESSSECYIVIANHPALPKLYPFQRIRLVNTSVSPEQTFFVGRINKIDPKFKGAIAMRGTTGYAIQLYVRDYMQALTDNFVQADVMHDTYAFKASDDAKYIPIYDDDACPASPPCARGYQRKSVNGVDTCVKCVEQPASSRYQIISDLVTRTGIIPDVVPSVTMPYGSIGSKVTRNYLDTPQTTVFAAVRSLAQEQPWDEQDQPSGTGYVFRVAPPGLMGGGAVFQYFQRSALEWSATQTFGWEPNPNDRSKIPIMTFRSLQEGQSIYSRGRVAGKGLASYTAPTTAITGMEEEWNPSKGLYRVTREAASNEEVLTQLVELQQKVRTSMVSEPDGMEQAFRGSRVGTITVVGIPINANKVSPIPGDLVKLDPCPPGLENEVDNNKYIISQWKFTWPEGLSTYQLNRRVTARSVTLNQTLMHRGMAVLSSMKDVYDSGWLVFDDTGQDPHAMPKDGRFKHNKGVIPRYVFVYAADNTEVGEMEDGASACGGADPNCIHSAVMLMPSQYDPIQNMFIGYQVTAVTPNFVEISFYPFLAFSQGAIDYGYRDEGQGWLKAHQNTRVRVFVKP